MNYSTSIKQAFCLLIFLFSVLETFGQEPVDSSKQITTSIQRDSLTKTTGVYHNNETDDLSLMQLFFVLVFIGVILLGIGVGIVVAVLALLILFGLVSFGIVSTSVIVGLNKKSFEKGFKTFIVLGSTIGGLLVGGTSFWLFNKVVHWWSIQTAILTGSIAGLLGGLGFGFIAFYVLQKLTTYLKLKLNTL